MDTYTHSPQPPHPNNADLAAPAQRECPRDLSLLAILVRDSRMQTQIDHQPRVVWMFDQFSGDDLPHPWTVYEDHGSEYFPLDPGWRRFYEPLTAAWVVAGVTCYLSRREALEASLARIEEQKSTIDQRIERLRAALEEEHKA